MFFKTPHLHGERKLERFADVAFLAAYKLVARSSSKETLLDEIARELPETLHEVSDFDLYAGPRYDTLSFEDCVVVIL